MGTPTLATEAWRRLMARTHSGLVLIAQAGSGAGATDGWGSNGLK